MRCGLCCPRLPASSCGLSPPRRPAGPPQPASVLTEHSRRVALPTPGLCAPVPRAGVLGEGGALRHLRGPPGPHTPRASRGPGAGGAGGPGPEVLGCVLPVPVTSCGLGKVAASCALGRLFGKGCRCSFSTLGGDGEESQLSPGGPGGAGLQSGYRAPGCRVSPSLGCLSLPGPWDPASLPWRFSTFPPTHCPCSPLEHLPIPHSRRHCLWQMPRARRDLRARLPWTSSSSRRVPPSRGGQVSFPRFWRGAVGSHASAPASSAPACWFQRVTLLESLPAQFLCGVSIVGGDRRPPVAWRWVFLRLRVPSSMPGPSRPREPAVSAFWVHPRVWDPGQFRDRPGKGLDPCPGTEEAGPGMDPLCAPAPLCSQ